MNRAAYINSVVGRPWSPEFSCWEFVRQVQAALFGRDLPAIPLDWAKGSASVIAMAFADHPERRAWKHLQQPADGSIALMKKVAGGAAELHCGVYLCKQIDMPIILHCDQGHGVIPAMLAELKIGWPQIEFYERT